MFLNDLDLNIFHSIFSTCVVLWPEFQLSNRLALKAAQGDGSSAHLYL